MPGARGSVREEMTQVSALLWLMGTRASTWAYAIHSELCRVPGHRIWEGKQRERHQPHLLGRVSAEMTAQWRQEERVFQPEKKVLVYPVFQMEGTASAKVQGLQRTGAHIPGELLVK